MGRLICVHFALVKHTADEFDRWYEEKPGTTWHIPTTVSLLVVFGATLLVSLAR